MTLQEVTERLEALAGQQPSINSIVRNDVYRLNSLPDAKYAVFAWLQDQHTTDSFSFSLLYIDRLTADRKNELEIQSIGISVLDNIIRKMAESGVQVDTYSFQAFEERFLDDCAGVLCNVSFTYQNSNCEKS